MSHGERRPRARSIAATLVFVASVLLLVWQRAGLVPGDRARRRGVAPAGRRAAPRAAEARIAACASCSACVTALLVIAVALSFRTLNGLAAGTALLVVMGALKLLEVARRGATTPS